MTFAIRVATPEDAPALSHLAQRAKASWGYPAAWLESWRELLTIRPETLRGAMGFVAEAGSEVLGVCVLEARASEWSLEHLWIAPERQRQGIGRRLLQHALEAARRAGATRIGIEADPYAASFYRALGARPDGDVPAPMPGAPDRILPRFVLEL
jgi:ribosomal protein S18 acetylase RimI-like enzyme